MPIADALPWLEEPHAGWQQEFDRLLNDRELRRRYDRERRLREACTFLGWYCPDVGHLARPLSIQTLVDGDLHTSHPQPLVVEIGTTGGEFLELARLFGYAVQGMHVAGTMPGGLERVCRMARQRQQIPVE
jgi:hypothetical protein